MIDQTTQQGEPALKIGAAVHAPDSWTGTLEKVVVDPDARRVTHLVVSGGEPSSEQRVVPIKAIMRVDAGDIHLSYSLADLEPVPAPDDQALVTPSSGWKPMSAYTIPETLFWRDVPPVMPAIPCSAQRGMPEGAIMLKRDMDVLCDDALVGTLDHLCIDPRSGRVTNLVVTERQTLRHVVVPQEWVREFNEDAVVLHISYCQRPGATLYPGPARDAGLNTGVRYPLIACSAMAAVPCQHHRPDRGACIVGGTPTNSIRVASLVPEVGIVVRRQVSRGHTAINVAEPAPAVHGYPGIKWGRPVGIQASGYA